MISENSATELQPQAALAMGNGKLATLIFLSTELMFFAALISSYLVLRFGAGGQWPERSHVHVEVWLGIINTLVLVSSSFCLWFAVRAAVADHAGLAKWWLLLTGILGCVFLGIKGTEYYTKFQYGIYPSDQRTLIYDDADEAYLSRASLELNAAIGAAEANSGERSRIDELYVLKSGVTDWTSYKVSQTGDRLTRQSAIEAMAHQIYPLGKSDRLEKYLADQTEEAKSEFDKLNSEITQTEASLTASQKIIKTLLPQRESGDADIQKQYTDESENAVVLTETLSTLQKELNPIKNHLDAVETLDLNSGVNEQFELNLPVVIPGGIAWTNTYYLLTGFHAVHLLGGLLVLAGMLLFQLGKARIHWLENFSLYWHFVDLVWIFIFVIIYLG